MLLAISAVVVAGCTPTTQPTDETAPEEVPAEAPAPAPEVIPEPAPEAAPEEVPAPEGTGDEAVADDQPTVEVQAEAEAVADEGAAQ